MCLWFYGSNVSTPIFLAHFDIALCALILSKAIASVVLFIVLPDTIFDALQPIAHWFLHEMLARRMAIFHLGHEIALLLKIHYTFPIALTAGLVRCALNETGLSSTRPQVHSMPSALATGMRLLNVGWCSGLLATAASQSRACRTTNVIQSSRTKGEVVMGMVDMPSCFFSVHTFLTLALPLSNGWGPILLLWSF